MRAFILALSLMFTPSLGGAVEPGEVLDDPVLEERARDLSAGLRCLVCRNESIDESDADLARDLRLLVRERLVAGDTDAQAIDYIVARYGEYVLLKPDRRGANLLLWGAGPAMLGLGVFVAFLSLRGRGGAQADPLSPAEARRLAELTDATSKTSSPR